MKKTLFFTCAILFGMTASAQSYYFEDSTPHNATAAGAPIDCSGCHDAPTWGSPQSTRNPYLLNKADNCGYCHNNKDGQNFEADAAPFVLTHSKATTKSKRADWEEACWDCHKNHSAPPTSALVTGSFSVYSNVVWPNPTTGTTVNGTKFTYSGASATDPAWSTPDSWMTKDDFQSPYNPDADPNSPSWPSSPCNPANINPSAPPDASLCEPGIPAGERGLNMWVTYSDGSKGAFEIVAASGNEITVSGRIPADKTLNPGSFALHYGMMVSTAPLYDHDKDPATPKVAVSEPVDFTGHFQDYSTLAYNERVGGADPDPTPNGICQVCHVDTKYWKADGTLTNHNNGTVCTKCHKHSIGFAPSGCDGCHTRPPSQGAHGKHASTAGYSFSCSTCHNGPDSMLTQFVGGGNIDIGFDPTGFYPSNTGIAKGMYNNPADSTDNTMYTQPNLVYYGVTGKNYKGDYGWSDATPSVYDPVGYPFGTKVTTVGATDPKANTCQNVYCHSQGKLFAQGFESPSTSPKWTQTWTTGGDPQNDNNTCNNCHAYPPSFDSHALHASRKIECYHCHYNTTYKDLADGGKMKIRDTKLHVNGQYNVDGGGEFIYNSYPQKIIPVIFDYTFAPGGGSCSSNQCHVMIGFEQKTDIYGNPLNISRKWKTYKQIHAASFATAQTGSCPKTDGATTTVSATITSTCTECQAPYTYEINWGDGVTTAGNESVQSVQSNNKTYTFTHSYKDKVPAAYETDPAKGVIGTWQGTWTVRDVYGITLDTTDGTGVKSVLISACAVPNTPPVPGFTVANTDYANAPPYEVELTDMSVDADYNKNQHYDPNGNIPGSIKVEWGGFAPGATTKGVTEGPIQLTNVASNYKLKFQYGRSGYYQIKHCIKDNDAGTLNYICSPSLVHYVTR